MNSERANATGGAAPGPWILLCHGNFGETLREEVAARWGQEAVQTGGDAAAGMVVVTPPPGLPLPQAIAAPFIFERQRMVDARWIAAPKGGGLAARVVHAVLAELPLGTRSWGLHVFAPERGAGGAPTAAAERLRDRVLRKCEAERPEWFRAYRPPEAATPPAIVVQLCVVSGGCWAAVNAARELTSLHPGGVPRLAHDPAAPSRSALKVEEALLVMGATPRAGERVVDLGAAPGGWSHAFLRRGCHVLAVDNGPMKIRGLEHLPGKLTVARANGLTFRPPTGWAPVDWLLSDMLVAPGPALGLLKRWIGAGWARRFVVNVKLPQRHPLPALRPIAEYLASQPEVRSAIRHLYHDRREVTVAGDVRLAKRGR